MGCLPASTREEFYRKMKVLLVDPQVSFSTEYGNLKRLSNVIPNLGLAYIAASLEQAGFDVSVLDCSVQDIAVEGLIRIIKDENPSAVGFTATVLSVNSAAHSAEALKKEFPGLFLFVGGPQVSALPEETMSAGPFDAGVVGEGESTVPEMVRALVRAEDLAGIPGLILRQEGGYIRTPERPCLEDIDQLPLPARHLFPPLSMYHYSPISTLKTPCAHIVTSRGCPYGCTFCDKTVTGSRFRARSPENIIGEIETLIKDFSVKEIKFFDDNFALERGRIVRLCDLMDERKLNIVWSCVMHAATADEALLKRMKAAGCWQVVFGMESGNQKILDAIHKPLTLEQSRQAVRMSHQAGLDVRATFMLGLPGETAETVRRTICFAKELKVDTASFYIFSPYPGSKLFGELKGKGQIIHTDYAHYQLIIDPDKARFPFVPEGLAEKDLRDFARNCYKEFYCRPAYLLSQLSRIYSFFHLRRYWRCFLALLDMVLRAP